MTTPRLSRRRLLAATAGGGAAVALGGPALAACSVPPEPDPLEPVAQRAEADARLAEAVAATYPPLAEAATALAGDRRAHARALRAELRRASGDAATSSFGPAASARHGSSRQRPPAPPNLEAARTRLFAVLRTARNQASTVLAGAPGHRAGLLASIGACCASHQAVLRART